MPYRPSTPAPDTTASGPFTLAELAQAAGMDARDVLLHQERGLLPERSGDGTYHQEHVDRLAFIGRALIMGFSLEAIARLIDTRTPKTCQNIHDLAEEQLERMRQAVGRPSLSAAILNELMGNCSRTGGLEDCMIHAALTKPAPRTRY